MRNYIDLDDGVFYSMGDGFVLLTRKVGPCNFVRGAELRLNSMLSMWELHLDTAQEASPKELVGYFFYSAMKTRNGGGFLVTFMESKRGKATECNLMIRVDDVMVYDFPGCGALAVSTKVNAKMLSILMEQ